MNKNDWIGWGTSFVVHAILYLLFWSLTTSSEPIRAGFIEVEFGPLSQGRPVQRTQNLEPEIEEPAEVEETQETRPEQLPEEETKPVDLPDQQPVVDEETVQTPDTDTIVPEQTRNEDAPISAEPSAAVEGQSGGGEPEGSSGSTQGTEGSAADEQKTAPFVLEGIDRTQIRAPLPTYADKVNAVIQMRITVDPRGRITRIVPLRKGNPLLERAVMDALRTWQFNALAPNVPQENQTGTITFTFRLQ